jgi:hypothetical protein
MKRFRSYFRPPNFGRISTQKQQIHLADYCRQ